MKKPKLGVVERGIYRTEHGYNVAGRAGKRARWKWYPLDASLIAMRAWRDGQAAELRDEEQPTTDTRTIAGAIDAYIAKTKLPKDDAHMPAFNALKRERGTLERRKYTPALAQQDFEKWKNEGYSPQSRFYRRSAIIRLWKALDGPTVKTPVDGIIVRRPKKRRPVWVSDQVILDVLMNLRRQELAGRLHDAKTRSRFLVLVTCGQRPAQVKLAAPADVEVWDTPRQDIYGLWRVRAAKGGEAVPFFLNSEQADAWRAFKRAGAWGDYDTRSFARTIRHAGWPAGVRPYNARHAFGFSISARGGDLRDIQDALGHRDPSTTRMYVGRIEERMKAVNVALEGRFRDRQRDNSA